MASESDEAVLSVDFDRSLMLQFRGPVVTSFSANAVRLELHDLSSFPRPLATPEPIIDGSLTGLKEKLMKIGAKVVDHRRYLAFPMAEVAIPRQMFQEMLRLITELRPPPDLAPA